MYDKLRWCFHFDLAYGLSKGRPKRSTFFLDFCDLTERTKSFTEICQNRQNRRNRRNQTGLETPSNYFDGFVRFEAIS